MPVSRMRMRPWLEAKIDSNTIAGLVWVDKVGCYIIVIYLNEQLHWLWMSCCSAVLPSKCSYAFLYGFQEQMMFSIPWKHAARHGWEVDKDACLFKQWAIHTGEALRMHYITHYAFDRAAEQDTSWWSTWTWTVAFGLLGKFREGVTQPDPKTWKANFRCAMNSLPDIEEVKDKSINKGCGAVRVYRMLPAVTKKKDKRSKNRDGRRRAKVRGEHIWS